MESEILRVMVGQGAWAVLFVWLFIDTRKESKQREDGLREESKEREEKLQKVINKNQDVISELAKKFDVVENIQEDVKDIKIKLDKVG